MWNENEISLNLKSEEDQLSIFAQPHSKNSPQPYKQLIIVRKDLNMSTGKLAAQVSHGSMAFLTTMIRNSTSKVLHCVNGRNCYETNLSIDCGVYNGWIDGLFTKIVLEAKNKNHLMKAVTKAEEMGLREGRDFFLIRDACLTELEPEEEGTTLTVLGFAPLPADIAHEISRKYQLLKS